MVPRLVPSVTYRGGCYGLYALSLTGIFGPFAASPVQELNLVLQLEKRVVIVPGGYSNTGGPLTPASPK